MVIYTQCQIHSDLILSSFLYSFLWNCNCLCIFNVIVILVVIVIVTLFVIVLFPWLMSLSCNCLCLFQCLFVLSSMKFSSCSIDKDTVCLFLTITLWIWLTITTTIQGFKRMVFKKLGKGHYPKINAFARCQTDNPPWVKAKSLSLHCLQNTFQGVKTQKKLAKMGWKHHKTSLWQFQAWYEGQQHFLFLRTFPITPRVFPEFV